MDPRVQAGFVQLSEFASAETPLWKKEKMFCEMDQKRLDTFAKKINPKTKLNQ